MRSLIPRSASLSLALGTLAFIFPSRPCNADVGPESAILIHVQPVTGSCQTAITNCNELKQTTTAEGPLEFLFFFYPKALPRDDLRLASLHADLVWPESWQLIEADPCSGVWAGFEGEGSMTIEWWPPAPLPEGSSEVFLVARLVMNVVGPGRLEFANPVANEVHLTYGGEPLVSWALGCHAEAGRDCEYTFARCGYYGICDFAFEQPEILLRAPSGGTAEGEVIVSGEGCYEVSAYSRASWATAKFLRIDPSHGLLRVVASAVDLPEGQYETSIQVATSNRARCLPVVFTVIGTSSVPDDGQPGRRLSWGAIKAGYRLNVDPRTP